MAKMKLESLGLMVHKKLKNMTQNYGVMMLGVPAELVGQMQAERSLPRINQMGNLRQQILNEVTTESHMMTEPTQSCGQASNDVCEWLLGKVAKEKFHSIQYEELSENGSNLKKALENSSVFHKNILIRFEIDSANYPTQLIKIKNKGFNPATSGRNYIYLLENKLYFLDSMGHLFNLGQSSKKCNELFKAIGNKPEYNLFDPFILEEPDDPEDFALCEIAHIFNEQKAQFDCWLGSHSFTIYIPQVVESAPHQFYPYQAYFGSHTLQDWFLSNKGEYLSERGLDDYIEKLALLGRTTSIKERSDIYAAFFSKRGREMSFCAYINERRNPLRVKFKLCEINPEVALENLHQLQKFIDTYPGEKVSDKVENYRNRTKIAMIERLENLLLMKPSLKHSLFFGSTGQEVTDRSDSIKNVSYQI